MHGVGFEPTINRTVFLRRTHLANPCYTLTGGAGQLKVVGPEGGAYDEAGRDMQVSNTGHGGILSLPQN